MKKILMFLVAVATFSTTVSAQADSVTLSAGSQNMVFYNLQNGTKTVTSNTDWHLAFSVRPQVFPTNTLQSTTIRTNEANGVAIYEIPGFTADSFSLTIDTAGFQSWKRVYDADSVLDEGAMNSGKNIQVFDYGWGVYSSAPNYNVEGKKVYLIILPNGNFKKFKVDALVRDTAWVFRYADLDNSNLQVQNISKKSYPGKNFFYFNLLNNQVIDKEPLSSQWDILFTKYNTFDVLPDTTVSVTGVLLNKSRTAYERSSVEVGDNNYSGGTFSPMMNTIGWDWKTLNQFTFLYDMTDSLSYFVQTNSGVYKIFFTKFEGSSTGKIVFNVESFGITRINEIAPQPKLTLYPNPTKGAIQLAYNSNNLINNVEIFNVNGALVASWQDVNPNTTIDLSQLENGLYFIQISTNEGTQTQKLLLQR
jgi:hypothetical protein